MEVRECPAQMAVTSDGKAEQRFRKTGFTVQQTTAEYLEHSFQLCLNFPSFHLRMEAAASSVGTLSLDAHARFILS